MPRKFWSSLLLLSNAAVGLCASSVLGQIQGPSTGSTPYAVSTHPLVNTYSIFTTDNTGAIPDDSVGGYGMVGIPDGLGAYDNGDGTFTVLMNHELGAADGVSRAHGAVGSFVSRWVINKDTLAVNSGADLIQNIATWNTGTSSYNAATTGVVLARLCSGDLAPQSAYLNSASGLGTNNLIFQSGEESGAEGRNFAHMVTGPAAGTSYELPRLGKFSWENSVASPFEQDKTVVVGTDDSTPGQVYVYVGTKTNSGLDIDKAGLTNGSLFGIKVTGATTESRTNGLDGIAGVTETPAFTLHNFGDISNTSGATLQSSSTTNGVTEFLRPEDGAWSTVDPSKFYFVTTDRYDQVKDGVGAQVGNSRLWELDFDDIANPENGGTIRALLDGTEQGNMFDNIAVDVDGNILIVEDVGGQAHNGKLWLYDVTTDSLTMLAKHDPARFGDVGGSATSPFNNDEEFSGIIDVTELMAGSLLSSGAPGERWYLMDDQTHYSLGGAQVQGGQLLLVQIVPEPSSILLMAGGLAALVVARRRRVKK